MKIDKFTTTESLPCQPRKGTYRTFSSYINAYTLQVGTARLGFELSTSDHRQEFSIPVATRPSTPDDLLFFTEESSLIRALKGELPGRFLPESFPMNLLDDKWTLATWLELRPELAKGPRQWALSEWEDCELPCLLKARHSWHGSIKLPRGWVCRSRQDVAHHLQWLSRQTEWGDLFFFQEWLGDVDCEIVSVCGFHDAKLPARNLRAVVKRIAAHHEGLSSSAAVATVADTWQLGEKATAILDELAYTGPYELEFLVTHDRTLVLELNPRFWMQHALFLESGNALITRYIGLDTSDDYGRKIAENLVWFDCVHLIFCLCRLRFGLLWLLIRTWRCPGLDVILWPPLPVAMRVWARLLPRKLLARVFPLY